jgi:hypothetical protein
VAHGKLHVEGERPREPRMWQSLRIATAIPYKPNPEAKNPLLVAECENPIANAGELLIRIMPPLSGLECFAYINPGLASRAIAVCPVGAF